MLYCQIKFILDNYVYFPSTDITNSGDYTTQLSIFVNYYMKQPREHIFSIGV